MDTTQKRKEFKEKILRQRPDLLEKELATLLFHYALLPYGEENIIGILTVAYPHRILPVLFIIDQPQEPLFKPMAGHINMATGQVTSLKDGDLPLNGSIGIVFRNGHFLYKKGHRFLVEDGKVIDWSSHWPECQVLMHHMPKTRALHLDDFKYLERFPASEVK